MKSAYDHPSKVHFSVSGVWNDVKAMGNRYIKAYSKVWNLAAAKVKEWISKASEWLEKAGITDQFEKMVENIGDWVNDPVIKPWIMKGLGMIPGVKEAIAVKNIFSPSFWKT